MPRAADDYLGRAVDDPYRKTGSQLRYELLPGGRVSVAAEDFAWLCDIAARIYGGNSGGWE